MTPTKNLHGMSAEAVEAIRESTMGFGQTSAGGIEGTSGEIRHIERHIWEDRAPYLGRLNKEKSGVKLLACRAQMIANGVPLLPDEEIERKPNAAGGYYVGARDE